VQHVAGVQVLTRSLVAGRPPAVLDLRGGFDPDAFAAAAAGMPAGRRYTALVPTQLLRLLDAGGAGLRALLGFDAVLVGGAACPAALLASARAAGIAVVTTYGMTETAGGCVYDGRPLRSVRMRIGGPAGTSCDGPAGTSHDGPAGSYHDGPAASGRVELAGPMLALGYRLDTARASRAATEAAFRGGWFRTGDHGRLTADGRLDVLGRLDEVIVTGGLKVAPAAVEAALIEAGGVAEACVVGVPDAEWGELVAAAVVARDPARPPEPAALRSAARELAGAYAVPKLIRIVPALPRTGPGKIDRAGVRELLTGPRPGVT